jgi:hypothetical protein
VPQMIPLSLVLSEDTGSHMLPYRPKRKKFAHVRFEGH